MMRHIIAGLLLFVGPVSVAQAGEAALGASELKSLVAGRTVFVSSPLGEIPIRYGANGSLHARTELAVMGGEDYPADHGRWWVGNNQLCMKWQNWMEGKSYCFTMHRIGSSAVRWHRNDGKTGTARLG